MMFNQLYTRVLRLILFTAVLAMPAISWSATISGRVYDDVNDIYMESARVSIRGEDISATTDRRGSYRLRGVDPGDYVVVAQVTGRPTITNRVTVANQYDEVSVNFNISDEDIFELEEFTVEGSLIGTAKGQDIRRSASDFREVVASDAFGQFTDRNPAEALQRVAGVTVEDDQGEGSFVLIRGGSPDLSNIQVDGVGVATPEEDGRQVNLNLITVDQLERIELSKTWLPEQKGNVIAGTVNMITRSALDRGERFASLEVAGTRREVYDEKDSWRAAVTFGDVLHGSDYSWMNDAIDIGLQFSVNQSEDFQGSDTITWGWNGSKDYPFQRDPGEDKPQGFTLDNLQKRNFNIDREREGGSARLELQLGENHEVYGSLSVNQFDDHEREHQFNQDTQSLAQFYSGTHNMDMNVVEELDLDPEDPFISDRLKMSSSDSNKVLTYGEAAQLGDIAFDEERKLFTRGGVWGMPMRRYYGETVKNDTIDTYQFGGEHQFSEDFLLDWTAYSSEASQESDHKRLRFSLDGFGGNSASGTGGIPLAGPDVEYPYIFDRAENPVLFNPSSFKMREPDSTNPGAGVRRIFKFESNDERIGYDINIEDKNEVGNTLWTSKLGISLDKRDKSYAVDNNYYGLNGRGSLDRDMWPHRNRQASLGDEFFDGGEIPGFSDNFGEELRFGPSFNEENTIAFLEDPEEFGAEFAQNENQLNDNFTTRVRNNYDATEDITGYYFQQTIDWKQWSFIFGARYEKTENTFTNLEILTRNSGIETLDFIRPGFWRLVANTELGEDGFSTEVTNERDYNHLLPAFHVIREIGENMLFRASVSKTMSRPKFTDLIPREIPSISGSNFGQSVRLPAFDLEPMESINYDMSFDFYMEPVGMFSVALFYKDLDGPIYEETRRGVGPNDETRPFAEKYTSSGQNDSDWNFTQVKNSGDGELMGLELTFDRQLNFLPGFLNGFGVNSNISWFESEATLLTELRKGETVPLFKQPDKTANFSIYYEKHGLFARLSFNHRGRYLNSINAGRAVLQQNEDIGVKANARDEYIENTNKLDFTLRYKIYPQFQVFFEAINLTNEPVTRSMNHQSLLLREQFTERVFTLGVKWNL